MVALVRQVMQREISVEMASGNLPGNDKLEREKKRLEINVNIGRPEEYLLNELNTRRLWTRAPSAAS